MSLQFSSEQITTPLHRFEHEAMVCDWGIFISHEDAEYARQAAFAAFEEIDRIETDLSRFLEGSDVRRLNSAVPGETIRIGLYARDCLLLAGELSELTRGAFDVMVARAMDEIRAGGTSHATLLPREPLLEIDPKNGAVTILGDGVAIDLGALGKGYAIDCAIQVLREWNIEAALAHAGTSSVYALGTPPDCVGWPLALRHPRDEDSVVATLTLRDAALGGSGFDVKGKHILDPRTGIAVEGKVASWCQCESAARADAFSTAFMVMSVPEIVSFQNDVPNVSGLVLLENESPALHRWGAFEALDLNEDALNFSPPIEIPIHGEPLNADPLLKSVFHRRVTIVWSDQTKRSGLLFNASRDWLQLQSDEGQILLVPREAIARIEVEREF